MGCSVARRFRLLASAAIGCSSELRSGSLRAA
jgi:hypothetical protein